MRNAGRYLPERSHFLCMDKARLRRLQLAQSGFSGVSCGVNGLFRTLALCDVAIDEHKAAARHWITSHLDHATVGSRALEAHFAAGVFNGAAQLRFEIGRILAAISEIPEILGIARPPGQEGVRKLEHLLEIAVPRCESRFCVEHDDAVAHVVEGDAKLGLTVA